MDHWSEKYVGEQGQGQRPCWHLLRRVWLDVAGVHLPSFEENKDDVGTLTREATAFADIEIGKEQPLDAVFMNTDIKVKGKWIVAEAHIGICVKAGLVLHVERGMLAIIEPMKDMRVTRIKAGPWHNHAH